MMNKFFNKIKKIYTDKEDTEVGNKFIEIIEIIYAIILACGAVKIVEAFGPGMTCQLWLAMFISIIVMVRFFFAPSKNIKIIGIKGVGWKWSIMPIDVPILISHSMIYYYMCSKIKNIEIFYRYFFILLLINSLWLFLIWIRLRKEKIIYIRIWAISNMAFFIFYLLSNYVIWPNLWLPLFFLALINSLFDLGTTYSDYFED